MPLLYAIVGTTVLAGVLRAPWYAAVVGSCVLALYLIAEDRDWEIADGDLGWATAHTASSIVIGAVAGPLSFSAGWLAAVTWGV